MASDIEIARQCEMLNIKQVAAKLGLNNEDLELYGNYKAKLNKEVTDSALKAKLILVTAINPTAAGEGKTTVSIGLADAMNLIGNNTCLALREPSLGPVFGLKGGATGGGYSQIVPMEDINLHFTGDFHAITAANNLLSALIDNSIFQGNTLEIDVDKVVFNRALDVNDRALRTVSLSGNAKESCERTDKFNITAACEIMAVLSLASDLNDLKRRLGNILIAYDKQGKALFCKDLKAEESMAILLKDALKPNLVQTIGGTPAIVHCGPFANIAHGCNSIRATKLAMALSDYTVTEAGFGADLGAEKFLDVKCRVGKIVPNAVVVVATARALKLHGGADKNTLSQENLSALENGMCNLIRHIENIKMVYKLPCVVAVNKFATDTEKEINLIRKAVAQIKVDAIESDVWGQGGKGATELAEYVVKLCESDNSDFSYCYGDSDSVKTKIEKIAGKIYGASKVEFSDCAEKSLEALSRLDIQKLPVVIAKTQYSFSDDPKLLGAPKGFTLTVRDVEYRGGAEFLVAIAGNMLLMPGLPKTPNAINMTISSKGEIDGLY